MSASSRGDTRAFGLLAEQVRDDLFRFALAQGLDSHDAAEATQEALLRGYRRRARWRGGGAMGWLLGVEMNVIREFRRQRRRRGRLGLDAALLETPAAEPADADRLAHLSRVLERLPARQREAVACRYLRSLSVRETAEVMGCAEGTVKAATAAGLKKLKLWMGADQ